MKTALITGITGQDGSYLAELLLKEGYRVFGVLRKSSSWNTGRIDHLCKLDSSDDNVPVWARYVTDNFSMVYGDLMDGSCVARLVYDIEPDEVYNLGAQAHVRVSFDQPELTMDVNAMGNLRLLASIESLNKRKEVKFYQASSSEMFGNHPQGTLLNEESSFRPCSPYAVAKTAAYWQTLNYRERGIFAVNGILFNHETVSSFTPMIYRFGRGEIDIAPISDICRKAGFHVDETKNYYQSSPISNLYVWDKNGWTLVKRASAYSRKTNDRGDPIMVNARNAVYSATPDHVVLMENGEKEIRNVKIGDCVDLCDYPKLEKVNSLSLEEARLLGALVGDGCYLKYTSSSSSIRDHVLSLWAKVGDGKWSYNPTISGFTKKLVGQVILRGSGLSWFKKFDIYTRQKDIFGRRYKKVPRCILNADVNIQRSFLEGYNLADGLKKNPCKYLFKSFKTNSPVLASGLLFLVNRVTKQQYNITVEESKKWGKTQYYYSINLLSDSRHYQNSSQSLVKYDKVLELITTGASQRTISRETGISRPFIRKVQNGYIPTGVHTCSLRKNEVKKILTMPNYDGWFYDLETESGTFHCGIGQGIVHNSPRRGATYVTRKITRAATRIYCGLQNQLSLGNLDAARDWGYAPEYVNAMYKMMQADEPEDFVVATGRMKTVREFLEAVFTKLGLNIEQYVRIDKRYFRPIELDCLQGDASKIKRTLGWQPVVGFDELVDKMVKSDLELAGQEK
ncbi:MAG: GDP-mannose 4,6-dehydratase [Promethearchaeota archaeon]|jgi:GDPmannose 4,6-dehydratase